MNTLSLRDLRSLAEWRGEWCVSIYQPAHRPAVEAQEDSIRFKNLLRRAEAELVAGGLRSARAREMLAPAQRLLSDPMSDKIVRLQVSSHAPAP